MNGDDMGLQFFGGIISFGALVAGIFPFTAMGFGKVPGNFIRLGVLFVTLGALKAPLAVYSGCMALQALDLLERRRALVTLKYLDIIMCANVVHKLILFIKGFAAQLTRVSLDTLMK